MLSHLFSYKFSGRFPWSVAGFRPRTWTLIALFLIFELRYSKKKVNNRTEKSENHVTKRGIDVCGSG